MLTKPYIIMLASYAILKVTAKVWIHKCYNHVNTNVKKNPLKKTKLVKLRI